MARCCKCKDGMETDEAILKAAAEVFAKKGFESSRVEDIAKCAGVAKGSVYCHFADKEELFFSVVAMEIEKMNLSLVELNDEPADLPFSAFIRLLVERQYRMIFERQGVGLMILGDGWPRLREDLRRRISERLRVHIAFVKDMLTTRAGLSKIPLREPENVTTAVMGLAFIFARRRTLIDEFDPPPGDPGEEYIRFIVDLLLANFRAKAR